MTALGLIPRKMKKVDLSDAYAIESSVQKYPWSEANFLASLSQGEEGIIVELANEIIGFVLFHKVLDEATILDIAVKRNYQGMGVGKLLIESVISQCQCRLFLEVRESNQRAKRFYEHFEFHEIGQRNAYYPTETAREDAIVMMKEKQ